MPLLEIKNLKMDFGAGADALRAVDGVSLTSAQAKPSVSWAKAAAARA
jgi:ABC-type antimicrobial peptide transport system ATPase subunit